MNSTRARSTANAFVAACAIVRLAQLPLLPTATSICRLNSFRSLPISRSARPNSPASRSEEHTSELQPLMRNSYAASCLKNTTTTQHRTCCSQRQSEHPIFHQHHTYHIHQ